MFLSAGKVLAEIEINDFTRISFGTQRSNVSGIELEVRHRPCAFLLQANSIARWIDGDGDA